VHPQPVGQGHEVVPGAAQRGAGSVVDQPPATDLMTGYVQTRALMTMHATSFLWQIG
jgi:hypothetical protein